MCSKPRWDLVCVYMRMSCANGCVVVLDWYLPRAFFRSGVSGAGVLMHVLCLFDGRGVLWGAAL